VSVTGPRIGLFIYWLWIVTQVILLWSVVPVLLAAIILWNGRFFLLAVALLVIHWLIGGAGAGCLWEWANLGAFSQGEKGAAHSFPVGAVKEVRIGRGWARNGLWWVIPQYIPFINLAAKGECVSFEAPNGERGRDGVYAFHMSTGEDAQALAGLLRGEGNG
jgi:hypothetical protein